MTFSTIPDTSFVNNVDLHQASSRDGDMPPPGHPCAPRRQRRQSQSPRHPGRDPHAPGRRAGPAARDPGGARRARPLPRLRPGGPGHLPDPVTGQLQRCRLAAAGGPAPGPPDAGGLRQRQAHDLYRLLYLARWSSGPCTRRSGALACPRMPPCWSPAAASATSWPTPLQGMRFIGVELDSLSGRIARALHPGS